MTAAAASLHSTRSAAEEPPIGGLHALAASSVPSENVIRPPSNNVSLLTLSSQPPSLDRNHPKTWHVCPSRQKPGRCFRLGAGARRRPRRPARTGMPGATTPGIHPQPGAADALCTRRRGRCYPGNRLSSRRPRGADERPRPHDAGQARWPLVVGCGSLLVNARLADGIHDSLPARCAQQE